MSDIVRVGPTLAVLQPSGLHRGRLAFWDHDSFMWCEVDAGRLLVVPPSTHQALLGEWVTVGDREVVMLGGDPVYSGVLKAAYQPEPVVSGGDFIYVEGG